MIEEQLDYSDLNPAQIQVVKEIAKIIEESGNPILSELILQKFFVVPKKQYDYDKSFFKYLEEKYRILPVQHGVSTEGDIEYPLFNITADIRIIEKIWNDFNETNKLQK